MNRKTKKEKVADSIGEYKVLRQLLDAMIRPEIIVNSELLKSQKCDGLCCFVEATGRLVIVTNPQDYKEEIHFLTLFHELMHFARYLREDFDRYDELSKLSMQSEEFKMLSAYEELLAFWGSYLICGGQNMESENKRIILRCVSHYCDILGKTFKELQIRATLDAEKAFNELFKERIAILGKEYVNSNFVGIKVTFGVA